MLNAKSAANDKAQRTRERRALGTATRISASISLLAAVPRAAPQPWQVTAVSPLTASQAVQNLRFSDEPQASQNRSPSVFSCRQAKHRNRLRAVATGAATGDSPGSVSRFILARARLPILVSALRAGNG
jgi:hypothetical protein